MDGKTTIKYLQTYVKEKDYDLELLKDYFLKCSEEVGELAERRERAVYLGLDKKGIISKFAAGRKIL